MRILFFDTETTGIPDWKSPSGDEKQPHLVQLAALLVEAETQEIIQSLDVVIKPSGWEIPADVAEIHGIDTARANEIGVPEKMALELFLCLWSCADVRVAHNTTFDNRIIRIATKRYSDEETINAWKEAPYECTGLLAKPIMKLEPKNRYGYKMPRLEEAYKFFIGSDLENAHSAMPDAKACMDVYFSIRSSEHTEAEAGAA